MVGELPSKEEQNFLFNGLSEILNPDNKLYKLSHSFPWELIEKKFGSKYSVHGRPAKPIRLMVSLLLLKHMFDKGDETVVSSWVENAYWQYFSGMEELQWHLPCEPSDLVHFRKRIGTSGIEYIFSLTVAMHGETIKEKEIVVDTTVQEKNITYPTDSKHYVKMIKRIWRYNKRYGFSYRQSYTREVKSLIRDLRFSNNPRNHKKAKRAQRRLHTIAGRLIREFERNLPIELEEKHIKEILLFNKILSQKKNDKNKIYSVHEESVYCMSKGKSHKKYEYGSKVSIATTRNSNIIVGAMNFVKNKFDGHTLSEVLAQVKAITKHQYAGAICDRGYKGRKMVNGVAIYIPGVPKKSDSNYKKLCARKRFRRRAAVEPIIGHLKTDNRLSRNFYKGVFGDEINVMLAASAFNLKKFMRGLLSVLNFKKQISTVFAWFYKFFLVTINKPALLNTF